MIPEFRDNVLPEGIHDCTWEELEERFGRFQRSDRRISLTRRLQQYIEEARRSGVAVAVIINGSYTTAKEQPSDIDLVLVLRPDFDPSAELRPLEFNVQDRRTVRRNYRFDVRAAAEGSEEYQRYIDDFSRVKPNDPGLRTSQFRKVLLRVAL
ncbi:MAG TPA: hypothetical protein VG013_14325 [Gemmataceae bacterium]|nr:hypothetical protein [Gemmataceae bacterium]